MAPRTPLFRPDRYFAERSSDGARVVLAAAVVFASFPAAVYGIGWVMTERIDGTVTVDNPDRPPEDICRNAPRGLEERCSRPAEIERNVDVGINRAIGKFLPFALIGMPLVVLLTTGLLHGAVKMAGGDGGFGTSLGIAVWGTVPSVLALAAALVAFWFVLDPVTVSSSADLRTLPGTVRRSVGPLETIGPVVSLGFTAWSAAIWRFGLVHRGGLDRTAATAAAVAVAAVLFLLGAL